MKEVLNLIERSRVIITRQRVDANGLALVVVALLIIYGLL